MRLTALPARLTWGSDLADPDPRTEPRVEYPARYR